MKRTIALLLVLASLLSLTACGGSAPAAEVPQTTAAPTEAVTEAAAEPTTEPTLSPEEQLYNSLSDRMKQAVDAGIVELSQLENPERIVTVGEASQMLQKAYVHRTGVESKTLADLINITDLSSRNATRGWIMNVPGLADMELVKGEKYESYEQWLKLMNKDGGEAFWYDFRFKTHAGDLGVFAADDSILIDDGEVYCDTPGIDLAQDFSVCAEYMKTDLLYGPGESDRKFLEIPGYGFMVYDRTNGKKFIAYEDGCVNPEQELTLEAAAEHALIYYNYPNPKAYPTFVSPEEVGTYNPEIITSDLLTRETTLPEASCQNLPKEWHGTVMDDFQYVDGEFAHLDYEIYEYEIQKVKEAGFNFIGLNVDFSWLQEGMLSDKSLENYDAPFKGLVNKEDVGKLSLERLEQVDQVIAWCMEYDIHVNLRCSAIPDVNDNVNMGMGYQIYRSGEDYAESMARIWQALARRYADIPNTYLSFTLFSGDYAVKNSMLVASVDAIREENPDRCIIAELGSYQMESEEFAQLGVALSSRLNEPEKYENMFFKLNYHEYWDGWQMGEKGKKAINRFDWPYDGKVDAQALLDHELYQKAESVMQVMETAQEYGVGFMVSDFGVTYPGHWWNTFERYRYADEPYFAMITDITSTIESYGYGWCFARWYGPYGVAFAIPAIQTSTYEQVEDYPYYIDQGMLGLFQKINGAA